MAASNKRARGADILSSLDAAFASAGQVAASKYTSQAAARLDQAAAQQAYAHKRKRAGKKKPSAAKTNGKNDPQAAKAAAGRTTGAVEDPLYRTLDAGLLAVGLRACSLSLDATVRSASGRNAVLKNYLAVAGSTADTSGNSAALVGPSAAVADKLKNKILQLDNPIRSTDAAKRAVNAALEQTTKLMSARQRREAGLHLLRGEMPLRDAELLSAIWCRYARDQLGSDLAEATDDNVRQVSSRVHAKLALMDLSGCPVELIRSRNPCNVGVQGVVVSETRHVLQVCCSPTSKIRTFPKADVTVRIRLGGSDRSYIVVDGAWLASRPQKLTG